MQDDSSRNTIIFLVCAVLLFFGYQHFVLDPAMAKRQAEAKQQAAAQASATVATPGAPTSSAAAKPITRDQALAASPRAVITTPALQGSVSLRGARIDDLLLTQFRQTVDKNSPPVELLRPEGAAHAWFAEFGWTGANVPGLPNAQTVWTLAQGSELAPGKPVVLTTTNGAGLNFTRKIEIDDRFMFTITDTVANTTQTPVSLAPYGSIQRQGVPPSHEASQIVHEGAVGALGVDNPTLKLIKYKKWAKEGGGDKIASKSGWVGVTDKYWFAALIPTQGQPFEGQFRVTKAGGIDIFDANFVGQPHTVAPGQQVSQTTRLFAGAKVVPVLKKYETTYNIPRFDSAVDWGNLWFFTRPIFQFLDFIYRYVGSFGIAILVLTVAVRAIFFPIAHKQYESMAKMRRVQPQVDELRAKFKDDPQKQQQELLALYQREKVNPLAGCLPVLLQIPVFFALYKVLTVTIEMRHAPFMGWIQDLSARDPTNMWNLFGLIPWDVAATPMIGGVLAGPLGIGIVCVLYGFTQWLSMQMSPPAPDPMQQKILQFMPIMFTFIMAPFAVGLLIYWTWSNVITVIQQYVLMRHYKVETPVDRILSRLTGAKKAAE